MLSNYQVLNAESRKYFQQILLLSGTAIDFNAVSDINHVDAMYAFAQNISQPAANLSKLIEVLQNAPAKQLLDFTSKPDLKKLAMRDWAPVIERMYSITFTSLFVFHWKMLVVVVFFLPDAGKYIGSIHCKNDSFLHFYLSTEANALEPIVVQPALEAYQNSPCLNITSLFSFTKEVRYAWSNNIFMLIEFTYRASLCFQQEYYSNISPAELQPTQLNDFIEHFNISLPIFGFNPPYESQVMTKIHIHISLAARSMTFNR